MNFNFPRSKAVDENGICGQVLHMGSKQMECVTSMMFPNIEDTAEKVMFCLESCETALRILQEKHGINLLALRMRVERKNMERGCYS